MGEAKNSKLYYPDEMSNGGRYAKYILKAELDLILFGQIT